ncbi:endonuclease/exonuclease/phosphatase family protein [Actinoplanes sp. M2I2]|uniref:endonuclease/exonuclease/phosphatase family protein n=1 Tax=Actinoplanes sp. M2I2 TaxID=1734444 RepID=UPI00201FF992|nr:endonuclease/exonuclease/phosphatase family protein [Actinoplanes sp. M2I2]
MRAMTWNVWWRFGGAWREREPAIADVLKELDPDVVGLVETWSGDGLTQPQLLADDLGDRHAAFAPTSLPPRPEPPEYPSQAGIEVGLGLISRWPIRDTEVHDLPHEQRPGPAPTALLATLDHPRGPLHVIVTCIEWEPAYAADQLAQSRALAALATDPRLDGDLPVLLLGDLNADVSQPDLAPLLAVLTDTWSLAGGDPGAVTLSSALLEAPLEATKQIDRRIDHILTRPGRAGADLTARKAFLAGTQAINSRHPSDHFAVVVDLDV